VLQADPQCLSSSGSSSSTWLTTPYSTPSPSAKASGTCILA
jgi:hypothetical protein